MAAGLQFVSDVHLEDKPQDFDLPPWLAPQTTHLAVPGDLCPLDRPRRWVPFLQKLSKMWPHIYWVNGNHELYSTTTPVPQLLAEQKHLVARDLPRVRVLDRDAVHVEGHDWTVLGATLWSYVPRQHAATVSTRVADYKSIYVSDPKASSLRLATVEDTNQWHMRDCRWLSQALRTHAGRKVVVLTHHAPLKENTSHPVYQGLPTTSAFASSQNALFKPNVVCWAFGHTHFPCDFRYRQARVVSHPVGYNGEDMSLSSSSFRRPLLF